MQVIEAQCSWSWRLTITSISTRCGRCPYHAATNIPAGGRRQSWGQFLPTTAQFSAQRPRVRRQWSLISRTRSGGDQYIAVAAPNFGQRPGRPRDLAVCGMGERAMKNRVPALGAVFVRCITAGIPGLPVHWRRGLAALSVVAAVLLVLGQPVPSLAGGQPRAAATVSAGPFNKVWTYALSQYAQASQTGQALTQLSDGSVVVG